MRHPRSVVRRCRKLLKSRPAEINRTTVRAISTVNIVLRSRAREALPPIVRVESRSPESSPFPVDEIAGTRPASNAAATTTGQTDQQTLRHLLADKNNTAAAKRTADRNLPAPSRRPRHQQIGEVQAGNQEHAAHRTQQYQ